LRNPLFGGYCAHRQKHNLKVFWLYPAHNRSIPEIRRIAPPVFLVNFAVRGLFRKKILIFLGFASWKIYIYRVTDAT